MAKAKIDVKTLIFCAIILVGLILAIVGRFGDFIKVEYGGASEGANLSDIKDFNKVQKIDGYAGANVFSLVTFIIAIVTLAAFVVSKVLGIALPGKLVTILGALTALCAIMTLIFAIVLVKKFPGNGTVDYKIAAGPILVLIGGLLAGCGAVLGDKKAAA